MISWNRTEYGDIGSINIDPDQVWYPEIILHNRFLNIFLKISYWRKISKDSRSNLNEKESIFHKNMEI